MYTSSTKIYDSDVGYTLALLVNMGHKNESVEKPTQS